MFGNIPESIKESYVISLFLTIISLISGMFLKRPELYVGFFSGSIISMINVYLIIIGAYKTINQGYTGQFRGMFEYLKRILIYCGGMYAVIFISRKFYPDYVINNIVATGAGFLNLKISLYINRIILKFAKKQ
ncbi:hypothetical protein EII29_04510 [Leptotrichia sp. OH3620_COT-345]|uniref:hypothetical protein n=1 Tax=Leptotrichia sp. OH3620_COT-345 TaxID=2491048 RepID=UPI000F6515BA|nr:hypothetical protein [Leptotrichia sp. OH3620_COT-345]RRD40074.1 hypothetical protein EII29_04510 [Leptotrichia sp. OH3620_COT-345]